MKEERPLFSTMSAIKIPEMPEIKNPMWEMLEVLKSIDKNVKEINAKLK